MFKKTLFLSLILCTVLQAEPKVLALSGSTRADSYNKKLVTQAAKIATSLGAETLLIDLKDFPMPFYDADLEKNEGLPIQAKRLRDLFIQSDVIVISTPQYNASIPAVLKNALDWLSRDESGLPSREAFKGKTFALMSASPGKKGAAKALAHLVAVIKDCGGEVLEESLSLGNVHEAFDDLGNLIDMSAKEKLLEEMEVAVWG